MPDQPNPSPTQPTNRAARRGKKSTDPTPAGYRGAPVSARPAQGRRVNPIRRTG